jgi:fructose-1,6-bisphosphatase/inositol monophosphatase family enzyme
MPQEINPGEFVEALLPAFREAASLARHLEGRVENNPKMGEVTEVKQALTAADTEVQQIILRALESQFPFVALAAEEDTPLVERFGDNQEQLVVIDPIDGTLLSYLRGDGPYSVLVGLVVRGQYRAALVALPREGLFFDAFENGGARVARPRGSRRPARVSRGGNRILLSNGTPASVDEFLQKRGFETVFSSGGAVSVAPLIAGVRAGLRWVPGDNGISIRGRIGALVSREAGAKVFGSGGSSFPSDSDSPAHTLLVCSEDSDRELLEAALATVGSA